MRCLACCLVLAATAGASERPTSGTVASVYDGDTITVESAGEQHKCRLLGIDAPELNHGRLWAEVEKVVKYAGLTERRELHESLKPLRASAKRAEAKGLRSRDALRELVLGEQVTLAYDGRTGPRDQYGRLLVYVTAAGADMSAEMLKAGLAVADTRFACERLNDYAKLWRAAQVAHVGLWGRAPRRAGIAAAPPPKKAAPEPARSPRRDVTVYITRTGKKYHTGTCSYLRKSRIPVSLEEAKRKGLTPCSRCDPPR